MKETRLSLRDKIGQMLVIGFPAGESGLETLRGVVEETGAGNLIIFSHNVGSAAALHGLLSRCDAMLAEMTGFRPLVAVDQEGGVVARVRRDVSPLPGAMAIGAAYARGAIGLEDVRTLGRASGRELLALGLNWNLAPVADVNVNPANPVINVRSYGSDPATVADLACAYAAGLGEAGVLATAKHFPGHGDTEVDSHKGLPVVPHGRPRLDAVELLPFRRLLAGGVPAILTAHVRFPAVEPEDLPATLSPRVISGLLRGELGFRGLVVTDCMEMKAVAGRYPDAAALAVKAGADLVCVSHTAGAQREAAASILKAVESGLIPESRIDEALGRILAAKAALPAPHSWEEASRRLAKPEDLELARRISRASLTLISGAGEGGHSSRTAPETGRAVSAAGLPPAPGSLYVDVEADNLSGAEDGSSLGTVASAIRARALPLRTISLPIDPSETDIAKAVGAARECFDANPGAGVVVGIYMASLRAGQRALLAGLAREAAARGRTLGVVSMRSPFEAPLVTSIVEEAGCAAPAFLCPYEYSAVAAESVADFLSGSIRAEGRLPVGADPRSAQ